MTAEFAVGAETEARDSWVPMITIALGQVVMSFNVASLPVALSGMVTSFNVPPTTVATGIVMYSLAVAGFVLLGAKLNQRFGALRVFRGVVVLLGIAQVLMTFSPTANLMLTAQLLSDLAGAALVPSLVALIAENYRGLPQATALGALGSARAGAGVAAFVIGGVLGTFVGWRPAFGILIVLSAVVFFLSFRLKPDHGRPDVAIDVTGVVLAGALVDHPIISPELRSQVDLDSINFVGNDRLLTIMQRTTATPEQVDEAVRINAEARLGALKIGLFAMAGLALLTLLPAGRLPDYKPGEMSPPDSSPQKL